VARSTFGSQNAKSTSRLEHFCAVSSAKSGHGRGASEAHREVKRSKQRGFAALLAVAVFKKRMPLWREAHVEVKMLNAPWPRSTFGSWEARRCGAKHIWTSNVVKY